MAATMTSRKPVSDLMFDWITVLHSKAEGVAAYDQYLQDAEKANATECVELFRKLQEQDSRMLEEVRDHVAMMMQKKMR